MTDGERQLIVSRLTDKGLLPYDDEAPPDRATLKNLTRREREVLLEILLEELAYNIASLDALRRESKGGPKFEWLRNWIFARWHSMILFFRKRSRKGAK